MPSGLRVYRVIACTVVTPGLELTQDDEVTSEQLGDAERELVESGVLMPLQDPDPAARPLVEDHAK